jgi:ubiquinone/menaquinone biosynthesis C-methylase UbiE
VFSILNFVWHSVSHRYVCVLFCCFYIFGTFPNSKQVAQELASLIGNTSQAARIVDLCCGVGTSTRTIARAFPNAKSIVGIDTSMEMIGMAKFISNQIQGWTHPIRKLVSTNQPKASTSVLQSKLQPIKSTISNQVPFVTTSRPNNKNETVTYIRGNAENTQLDDESADLVTIMYAFHEIPQQGRDKILQEARRLLRPGGYLAVVDITKDYEPSDMMLAGEPYILEYQSNIHQQLSVVKGFRKSMYKVLVPGHVGMWTLQRV